MVRTIRAVLQHPPIRVRPSLIQRTRRILESYAQQRATPFLRKKFLVIEDEPSLQHVLQKLLNDAGADVQTAASGEAALELVKSEKFDLITTGIVMPGRIDGLELLRRLKALPGFKTPVVILSSNDTRKVREKGRALGAAAHLAKPFDNDELVLTLRNALDRSGDPGRRLASFWERFRQDGSRHFLRYLDRLEAKRSTRPYFNPADLSAVRSMLDKKIILIISSVLEISDWLQRSLDSAGADVWTASDAAMTSTLAAKLKLDLVLVDLEMKDWPIVKETLHKLKARPGFKASIVTIGPRELKNGTGHRSVVGSSGHIRLNCRPQDFIESLKRVMKRT